ncbi:MAG TPA: response regulator transcription factor [Puia sp.]|nr:response regulator transcription factor [Puia sp.]
MIRVSVFDDNKNLLEGLELLLKDSETITLAGIYPNARQAVSMIAQDRPDVVLMDIKMPGISGIEAVQTIKAAFPQIHILMQTVFEDDDNIFAAICAGASGYILKSTPSDKILEAITDVYLGGSPMSPPIARKVLQLFQHRFAKVPQDFQELSPREKQVLSFMVKGLSYKMIADECKISFNTVHSHIKKVYEKLHVNSASEAVAKAIQQRIV